ncbi:COG3519 Type VI protein secretion system component VasA [Rhabdaerophilaceae bacterium]
MPLNPYYEDELNYLRELGEEFARANPMIAGFLSREGNDPEVERLLEGFAFLIARLRQKLEDEMPELVHGLIRLIWPHYLRTVPPMTMMQFGAVAGAGDIALALPAHTVVQSVAVDNFYCRFRTCYATKVLPLAVRSIDLDNRVTSARLTLTLDLQGRAVPAVLAAAPLRLFLNGERDPAVGRLLLAFLLRHVRQIVASASGREITLGPDALTAGGFGPDEVVLPYPSNGFAGFRILQEYLAFPEKFLFADLAGLEALASARGGPITLRFEFDRPFPEQFRASERMIMLNCVPAINLYATDALPIRLDRAKTDYRIKPSDGLAASIHSVDRVTGYFEDRGTVQIEPFESMRHDLPGSDPRGTLFFRERLRPATVGQGVEHYLAFVTRQDATADAKLDMASVQLTCSNGPLTQRLGIGSVDRPHAETPSGLVFRNVTAVTREAQPPVGDAILWRLISNLSRNYGTISDVASLRSLIASYDFRAVYDSQARRRLELMLEGIESIRSSSENALLRGVPMRVRKVVLQAAESKLGGEGELFLLGAVIDSLLGAYAGINTLHRFSAEGTETNARYRWPLRIGMTSAI